jgi:hypothetical protein
MQSPAHLLHGAGCEVLILLAAEWLDAQEIVIRLPAKILVVPKHLRTKLVTCSRLCLRFRNSVM